MSRRVSAAWALFAALGGSATFADPASVDAEALLQGVDAVRSTLKEGIVRLRVSRVGEAGVEEDELELYVGGAGEVLAVFRAGRQQGRRLLAVEGESWLLVPGTRHAIAVAGQQRLAGELAIADLVGSPLAGRYAPTLRPATEVVGGVSCRVLDLIATAAGDAHPTAALWLGAEDGLPRRLLLRLPSGRGAREIVFEAFRSERGRVVAERLLIRDLLRHGGATRVDFLAYESRPIEPSVFTVEGARGLP